MYNNNNNNNNNNNDMTCVVEMLRSPFVDLALCKANLRHMVHGMISVSLMYSALYMYMFVVAGLVCDWNQPPRARQVCGFYGPMAWEECYAYDCCYDDTWGEPYCFHGEVGIVCRGTSPSTSPPPLSSSHIFTISAVYA